MSSKNNKTPTSTPPATAQDDEGKFLAQNILGHLNVTSHYQFSEKDHETLTAAFADNYFLRSIARELFNRARELQGLKKEFKAYKEGVVDASGSKRQL